MKAQGEPCKRLKMAGNACVVSIALACAGFAIEAPRAAAADFLIHDGDSPVVFLGDSITDQKLYTSYVEAYVLTRFPTWNVTFRNVGWSGDTSWMSARGGYDPAMERDVLSLKPAVITIDYGMNDARGGDRSLPLYIESQTKIVEALKAAGTRVILLTPSPEERYEENEPAGSDYNNMLWKFSTALKGVAEKENVAFIDQYSPFVKVIEDGRKARVLAARAEPPRLMDDGVHPNWAGHVVMADAILRGMGAPALVSSLEIDAGRGAVVAAVHCKAEIIVPAAPAAAPAVATPAVAAPDTLSFTRTDDALPMPIPDQAALALKLPNFAPLDDLSQYLLKVTNLKSARYLLTIDGDKCGVFSKEELAAGTNLSLQAGPITDQAQKVLAAVMDKNSAFAVRWRNVQLWTPPVWLKVPDLDEQRKAGVIAADQVVMEKEKQLNALRQPLPHKWILTAAK